METARPGAVCLPYDARSTLGDRDLPLANFVLRINSPLRQKMIKRLLLGCCVSMVAIGLRAAPPTGGEYIMLVGGPSMYQWEKYKAFPHDHWWANFVRAARLRTEQIRSQAGPDAKITWLIYRQGYEDRAKRSANTHDAGRGDKTRKDRLECPAFGLLGQKPRRGRRIACRCVVRAGIHVCQPLRTIVAAYSLPAARRR